MIKRSCLCAALMLALAGTAPVLAQVETRHAIEVPAQDLGAALRLLAQQARLQIVYSADLVEGKRAPALSGPLTTTHALEQLLRGSGLKFEFIDAQTVTLTSVAGSGSGRTEAAGQQGESGTVTGGAHAQSDTLPAAAPRTAAGSSSPGGSRMQELESITVTGTRIRGGETPSPVITIGSERIEEEGFNDLGEAVRNVPQNYSGGQNPGVIPFTISGAGGQNANITGGSALNLRGLGQDASLTLLNGRRMAYGGVSQGVDVAAIPIEAVERIEIVADGASAIYGSDAVGGVANVILKRDFDGFAVSGRYGGATQGGLSTREYTATAGASWSGGGVIATYKDISTDPIYARQRDYTRQLRDPWTLYPASDLKSGLLSLHQSVGERAELRLDVFRAERDQVYSVHNDVGNQYVLATPETTTSMVSPDVEFWLPNDWTLSVGGAWAKAEHQQFQSTLRLLTGVTTFTDLCVCTESRVHEIGAEGPLFSLSGGDARLAVGAGRRDNDFLEYNRVSNSATVRGDQSSRFAYAEINLPVLRPSSNSSHAPRFEIVAAIRGEDYDSFGRVSTPKVGMIYGPGPNATLKTSWGKSFKAPTLYQLLRSEQVLLRPAASSGGAGYPAGSAVLFLDGGNPDLEPERARTWTASLAFHPEALPGLEAELTWFDIHYMDRVVQPITDPTRALSHPGYAEFVQLAPTVDQQSAIIARDGDGIITNQTGAPYDPGSIVAIVYFHFRNAVEQRIRGLDLSSSYRVDLGPGRLVVRGSASWLDSVQRFATTELDLAGTLHNPPRLSSRFGAVWTHRGLSASAFSNYKSGLLNTMANEKTASFTTFDTTLRYAMQKSSGVSSGLEFSLSMQNVFDRPPPLHDIATVTPFLVPPYDATNYSPIGRFVSLSISKRW